MAQELFGSSWTAKLGRLVETLRSVHKSLIDATQRDYEKVHGRIANPYALFTLVAQDPAFAWLQPMTRLIVDLEDLAGRKSAPVGSDDFLGARHEVQELIGSDKAGFAGAYRARVQGDPAVAVEHGRLHGLLRD
jgi:hypothetical protein